MFVGIYLTLQSKFLQFKVLWNFKAQLRDLNICVKNKKIGVHPLKLYFASIGGMIGLGNIASISTTLTIGGPGALIWLWISSLLGMLVKYSEVYLAVKYRVKNNQGSYDGGPMFYLRNAFNNKYIPIVVCVMLCFYSIEVYQFLIMTDSVVRTFQINKIIAVILILLLVLLSSIRGIKGLADVCSFLMPPFIIIYICIGFWIAFLHHQLFLSLLREIFSSFFTLKSQIVGIIGGGVLISAHYGLSNAVYSGDIGIGYDSVVQSETTFIYPEKQAKIAIYSLFADTIICTITVFILLVSGIWKVKNLSESDYIFSALRDSIPYAEYFITSLFFVTGFTTVVGYLVIGRKCAKFISKEYGSKIYMCCSMFSFLFFSFFEQFYVKGIMFLIAGILMTINIIGIIQLRKEIIFF